MYKVKKKLLNLTPFYEDQGVEHRWDPRGVRT